MNNGSYRTAGCVIIFLLLMSAYCAQAQPKSKQYLIDSLKNKIHKGLNDTLGLKAMLQIAEHYIRKPGEFQPDMDSAEGWIKRVELLAHHLHKQHELVDASFLRGRILLETKHFKEAKQIIDQSAIDYEHLGDLGDKAFALRICARYWPSDSLVNQIQKLRMFKNAANAFNIVDSKLGTDATVDVGEAYMLMGDYTKAIHVLDSLESACADIKGQNCRRLNYLLSIMHTENGNLNAALQQTLKLEKKAREAHDGQFIYIAMAQMGDLYYTLERYELSLNWLMKMLALVKTENPTEVYSHVEVWTRAYINLGQPEKALALIEELLKEFPVYNEQYKLALEDSKANCYASLGKKQIAEQHYLAMLNYQPKTMIKPEYLNDIGRFYFDEGNLTKARAHFINALNGDHQVIPLTEQRSSLFLLSKIDSIKGNFKSAYSFLRKYQKVNDSIFSLRRDQQFEELQIGYETEKKEKAIELLTQQADIQNQEIQSSARVRNYILFGSSMLMVLLVLLYKQYRINRKSNKEIENKNYRLERLVEEKEWLLREVHHRVKNNLQTVVALLESQSVYLKNSDALSAILDSQNRVNAMSLIHQKLYQSANVSTIDMDKYLRELVSYLSDSFNVRQRIHFELNIEPIELDVSQAIPIGLILNEAITNAIKYAFPRQRVNDQICIQILTDSTSRKVKLHIHDNGVGLPAHLNKDNATNSLGLQLMQGLAGDIDGTFSVYSNGGVHITIEFISNIQLHNGESFDFAQSHTVLLNTDQNV